MRNNKYIKLTLGLLFLLTFSLKGISQDLWSLEKCVNYAIENNIQIKQQALNANYSENLLNEAKYDIYPNLNANSRYSYNLGRTISGLNTYTDENSSSVSFGINTEVTVFNGFVKQNTIKKRQFDYQAALKDLEKAKDDIALNVASAYLDILFNKELLGTAIEQLEVTKQQIEYNKKQVDAGNLAKGKLLETEAQLANEELTVANYENELQLSLLSLMQLLELDITNTFDIVIPEFDETGLVVALLDADAIFANSVNNRPEIQSQELNLQSKEKDVEIAKAQSIPSLVAGANYGTYYNNSYTYSDVDANGIPIQTDDKIPFGEQLDNYRSGAVYLSLNIPIFNGFKAKLNHQNSLVSLENAKYELELEKNNLLKTIQQVHANATAAMKKYYASEKALKSAQEAFRYVQEKFNLGIVTPLEFNDSKNKVTTAQSSFIQAKYEYIFRVKILDFYNGKEITL